MRAIQLAPLLAALALPVGPALAQDQPADSVTLHFDWPVGLEARVRYRQVMEREGESDQPSHTEVEGEYAMHVHEHPQGLLIEHLDPVATRFQSSPPLPGDDPRRLLYSRLGPPTPHYVVSAAGELIGVDGIPALQAAVGAVLGLAPGSAPPEELGALVHPAQLLGVARERWNAQVGMWLDAVLRIGESGTTESQEVNALLPSVVMQYLTEFKLVGLEPCEPRAGAATATCARLEILAVPDPVEMNRVTNQALADMGFPNLSFDGLAQQSLVTLVTEPGTLLPREVTMSKLVQGVLKDGEQRRVFRRFDQTLLVYTYEGG